MRSEEAKVTEVSTRMFALGGRDGRSECHRCMLPLMNTVE